MSRTKRLTDITLASLAAVLLAPLLIWLGLRIWRQGDGPVFYISERMKTPTRAIGLVKFRTMVPADGDTGVTGPQKAHRITPFGAMLRRRRLDELPQLWNILKGDISLVGPRPPLREYVDRYPDIYARVLRSTPGVTGLATLSFNQREARLLANCTTAQETDRVYCRRCIPTKARLDLAYQRHASLRLDMWILWRTLCQIFARQNGTRLPA